MSHNSALHLDRSVINQSIVRVILLLQTHQPLYPPALVTVPVLLRLITVRIVNISVEWPGLVFQSDLPKLLPSLYSLIVERRAKVDDHGANKMVVEAIRERGRGRIDRMHTLGRVVLEQEKAIVKPGLLGCDVCKFIEEIAIGSEVVRHETSGKPQSIVQPVSASNAVVAISTQRRYLGVVGVDDGGVRGTQRLVHVDIRLRLLAGALIEHAHADHGQLGINRRQALVPDKVDVRDRALAIVGNIIYQAEDLLQLVLRENKVCIRPNFRRLARRRPYI